MTGRQTPSGKVPLPVLVCVLKSPSPLSVTQTTGVFLFHFFNVFTFSGEDSVLSYFSLLYPTSATCQCDTSNWLKLWKTTFFCPKLMQNSKEWCFQVNLNYSGLPLFSSHVKNKVWQGWQEESSSLCPEVKLLSGEGRNKLLQKSGGFTDNSCYYLCQTGKASSECGKEERGMLFIQCWKTDYLPDCKEYQKGIESFCLN